MEIRMRATGRVLSMIWLRMQRRHDLTPLGTKTACRHKNEVKIENF